MLMERGNVIRKSSKTKPKKKREKGSENSGVNTMQLDDCFKTKHTKNYIKYKMNKESS